MQSTSSHTIFALRARDPDGRYESTEGVRGVQGTSSHIRFALRAWQPDGRYESTEGWVQSASSHTIYMLCSCISSHFSLQEQVLGTDGICRSASNGFAGIQHNRGDHQSFTAGFAGIQHNRGDHRSFMAGFAGIQHNRGDFRSFAVVLSYVSQTDHMRRH